MLSHGDAGALSVAGTLLASAIALENTTLSIAGFLNTSLHNNPPVVVANGGEIDVTGSVNAAVDLLPIGNAPINLNESAAGGARSATLLQPGTLVANGNVSVSGTTAAILVEGGTVTDAALNALITFAASGKDAVTLPDATKVVLYGVTNRTSAALI